MKFRHYYASDKFEEYNCEQPLPLKLATHQLTKEMVGHLIIHHASGFPPYRLYVPRSILHEAHKWEFPKTLLQIFPRDEEEDNVSALATADLLFDDKVCFIHARRCSPYHMMGEVKSFDHRNT